MRRATHIATVAFFLTLVQLNIYAQTDPIYEAGFKPFGSFKGGAIDAVNLLNLKLNLRIPLASYSQRGDKLHVGFNVQYTDMVFQRTNFPCPGNPSQTCYTFSTPENGVVIQPDFAVSIQNAATNIGSVISPDGAAHGMFLIGGLSTYSIDGTAYRGGASGSTFTCPYTESVTDNVGVQYVLSCGTPPTSYFEDPNGNRITENYNSTNVITSWTDTLGRTISAPGYSGPGFNPVTAYGGWTSTSDFSGCTGALTTAGAFLWSLPGPNGTTDTYKMCYATVYVNVPNICHGNTLCVWGERSTPRLQSIVLPNKTTWTFKYDSATPNDQTSTGYGDLIGVTFPTGGTLAYAWSTLPSNSSCSTDTVSFSRSLATRTLNANDGLGNLLTKYSLTNVSGVLNTTVTDATSAANQAVHTFTHLTQTFTNTVCGYYETQEKVYSGSSASGTLLKTVNTSYVGAVQSGTNQVPALASQVNTIWNGSGQQAMEQYTYEYLHVTSQSCSSSCPISDGNILTRKEYAFGSGAPGGLLRTTTTSYLSSNSNYVPYNLTSLPTGVTVTDGGGTQRSNTNLAYDENALASSGISTQHISSPPNGANRGNLTSVHRWLNGSVAATTNCNISVNNGFLVNYNTYFDTGVVQKATDPCGASAGDANHTTTFAYSTTFAGAYPTTVTNSLSQTLTKNYDFNTGLLTSTTDANNQAISYAYEPLTWRISQANYPDGGQTTICYGDVPGLSCSLSAPPYTAVITKKITSTLNEVHTGVFDGVGRISQSQLNSDSPSTAYTQTKYDALGRKSVLYNPTRCNPPTTNCGETTWGFSTINYDPLNRVTSVVEQDGSTSSTNFAAFPCTTVTDEAGKSRKSCVDSLGRITGVWEDPAGLNYETDYTYDVLDNLLTVTQKGGTTDSTQWRNRTFSYDSLSQLLTASNPESGTLTYTYDAGGNVSTKTAPAPNQTGTATVTTTYTYDALNRPTQKSYNDSSTPSVFFAYDGPNNGFGVQATNLVGRLDEEWTGTSCCGTTAEIFGYDQRGRIVMNEQYTSNMGYHAVNYTYDLAGDLTSGSNGEGVTINYSYGAAARPTGVTSSLVDSTHPATLFTVDLSLGYFPTGELRKGAFGNGLLETNVYNNRLQPCRLNVNSSSTALGTCGDSIPSGSVQDLTYGFNAGTSDNGNIATMVGTGNQVFNRTYGYDALNRLSTMADSASNQGCKGLHETYDAWGNRTNQSVTSGSCFTFSAAATTQNRLSGYSYDAAGNMTGDGSHTYTYDAENRLVKVDGGSTATYVYDAEGRRAEKTTSAGWRDYIRDLGGQVVAEVNANGWQVGYVYLGASFLAQYSNSTTYFVLSDHLGSTRVMTNMSGGVFDSMDYQPFGEQIAGGTGSPHKFTGKERDAESGLDNFGFRYNASTMGRFMTPDPSRLSVFFTNPQTWNRYSYVYNNPLRLTDDNGKWPTDIHNRIIDNSFPNLTAAQRQILKNVSAQQDSILAGGQANDASFEHAMRGPDQTVEQAQGQFNDFVSSTEDSAQTAQWTFWLSDPDNAGSLSDEALARFGEALHAILDSTSPAHAGFQKWDGRNPALVIAHHNAEKTINDQQMQNAINAARSAFNSTFGIFDFTIAPEPKATVTVTVTNCVTDSNGKKICDTQ